MTIKPGSILFDHEQNPYMILNVINKQSKIYKAKNLANIHNPNDIVIVNIKNKKVLPFKSFFLDSIDSKRMQQKEDKLFKIINNLYDIRLERVDFLKPILKIKKQYDINNIKSKYIAGRIHGVMANYIDLNIQNELKTYNKHDIIDVDISFNNVVVIKEKYICYGMSDIGYYFYRFDRKFFI